MRIDKNSLKKNKLLLFISIISFISGILLIAFAPDACPALSDVYFTNAQEYEMLMAKDFYPVGVIGSETNSGREYTYYVISSRDAGNADYLFVLKSANDNISEVFENQEPTAFSGAIYGSAVNMPDEVKQTFDELVKSEKLDEKYSVAQWCFEDSYKNIDAQSTLCILSGFILIIASFIVFYIFITKIKKNDM